MALALEQVARRKAEDAVRTRDDLISAAVHDLKNPLAAIRGWATLVERRARGQDTAGGRLAEGLTQLQTATRRMESMVDELLEVAELVMGQAPVLRREPTDLVALASRVIKEHQQGTTAHHLKLEAAEDQLVGTWDPLRLERILGNLLSNAIKYSPHGGEITVRVARSEGYKATLSVTDPGVGIPEGDLERIFDPFQRGENVPQGARGKGVGLRYVKRIVDEHGGTVRVDSQQGRGSTFTIELPLEPPAEQPGSGA